MKILVLGADGQLGRELQRTLTPLGELIACNRRECDLLQPEQVGACIARFRPGILVNAAAYTAVDKAESEPQQAFAVNAAAVELLAQLASANNATLVHYSTDYVFDGTQEMPYDEKAQTSPLNVYGQSKLDGERAIVQSGCRHLIFRTSWVYSIQGNNFVKTVIRLLGSGQQTLRFVDDQVGAPTSAALIADVTALCLYRRMHQNLTEQNTDGLYHLTASGHTSWYGFAKFIAQQVSLYETGSKAVVGQIQPVSASEYPTAARRPANSRLVTLKIQNTFGIQLPDWQYHVRQTIEQLCNR